MPLAVAAILCVLLFVMLLTGTVAGPWFIIAIPVILVVGTVLMVRSAAEGAGGGATGAPEPTGMPRSSGGGAETANERVGQA